MSRAKVGPVLNQGPDTAAFLAALQQSNPELSVLERPSYVRALAPERCVLRRADLDAALGGPCAWPACLELIMPSFQGRMELGPETVVWSREPS